MMNFLVLTVSFTIAILAAGIISTAVIIAVTVNPKTSCWLMKYYLRVIENSYDNFDKEFDKKDLGA